MALLALREAVEENVQGPVPLADPRWLYGVQIAAALIALIALRRHYRELADPPRSLGAVCASIGVGLTVFAFWVLPMPTWLRMNTGIVHFVPLAANGQVRWDLVALRSFGAVFVVPVMEELFWRSFLLRWIDRRDFLSLPPGMGSLVAIGLSSAVFALAHELWMAGFLAGVSYAIVYRHFGKLWCAIIAHASTNLALAAWVVAGQHWSYW